jgi:hypothetical protein
MSATIYNRDSKGIVISQTLPLYRFMASAIGAYQRCKAEAPSSFTFPQTTAARWKYLLEQCEANLLPRGSGIDNGTKIDMDRSRDSKIVLTFDYHHMDKVGYVGYYTHWSSYTAIITPTFDGFAVNIRGCNTNNIIDYLPDTFAQNLGSLVLWTSDSVSFYQPNTAIEANCIR